MSNFKELLEQLEELKRVIEKREKLKEAINGNENPEKIFEKEIRDSAEKHPEDFFETEEGKGRVEAAAIVAFRRTDPTMCLMAGMAILEEKIDPNLPATYTKFKRACAEKMVHFAKVYLAEIAATKADGVDVEKLFKM